MKQKLREWLKTIDVYNVHDLLSRFGDLGEDCCVSYRAPSPGRMGYCDCRKTQVWSPACPDIYKIIGCKKDTFLVAVAWATRKFGITEWVAWGRGVRIPKYVFDRAIAEFKRQTAKKVANEKL